MINTVSSIRIAAAGQDYSIIGDGKPIVSGLTKEESDELIKNLKNGLPVGDFIYEKSAPAADLDYWKEVSQFDLGSNESKIIPISFITPNNLETVGQETKRDLVFFTIGCSMLKITRLGNRVQYILLNDTKEKNSLKKFKEIAKNVGIILVGDIYFIRK